jgi:hypothetical protein
MKKILLSFCVLCAFNIGFADNIDLTLKKNWTVEKVNPKAEVKFHKDEDGKLIISTTASQLCISSPAIKYDKGKMHYIEGYIKSNAKVMIALYFYDKDGKEITSAQFNCVSETDTILAEAVNKKDTIIKVKDASNWHVGERIAFNTKPDLSDLPTPLKNLLMVGITKIVKHDNYYEIHLKYPVGKDYPSGTGVRQTHNIGNIQRLCTRNSIPVKPIFLDTVLKDEMSVSKAEREKWWPIAETVKLKINQHGKENLELQLEEFLITESPTDW